MKSLKRFLKLFLIFKNFYWEEHGLFMYFKEKKTFNKLVIVNLFMYYVDRETSLTDISLAID